MMEEEIFSDFYFWDRLIEMSTASAIIGYVTLILIVSEIWKLFQRPYSK